jgi:hypothetical protein
VAAVRDFDGIHPVPVESFKIRSGTQSTKPQAEIAYTGLTPSASQRTLQPEECRREETLHRLRLHGSWWSRRRDLNPRPTHYECVALPLSYPGAGAMVAVSTAHHARIRDDHCRSSDRTHPTIVSARATVINGRTATPKIAVGGDTTRRTRM